MLDRRLATDVPLTMDVAHAVVTFDFGRHVVALADSRVTLRDSTGIHLTLPAADLDLAVRLAHAGALGAARRRQMNSR